MAQTTLSPKFQVVIPKEIRRQIPIHKGQKFQVIVKNGIISLIPEVPLESLRGLMRGASTEGTREKKDRY